MIGPVEIAVIALPSDRVDGRIVFELRRLLSRGTLTAIDALLVTTDQDGAATVHEIDDLGPASQTDELAGLLDRVEELLSHEDVLTLATDLQPGQSALVLVLEHTWVRPLREAVVGAGGHLVSDLHVPADAVADVVSALERVR